jgi:pimeloyl-ACP methyl ester carboxylesterase
MPSQYRGLVMRIRTLLALLVVVAAACSASHGAASGTAALTPSTTGGGAATPGGSTTGPPNLPLPPVAPIAWKACTGTNGPSDAQCATLQVPLNYADPSGTHIGIAVARHPASGTKIGSLLFNPGGPGASGIDFLDDMTSLVPSSILDHFDLVGFDPRGVDRSAPVRCETGPQLDQFIHANPAPTTAAGFQQLVAVDQAFVNGCVARSGPELPYVGTVNAARDMDEIRAAVGDAKLTYLGFSYGTFLGAVYAQLFPTHIRAMVLDGDINPQLDPVTGNIDQAAAFDQNLQDFFNSCTDICAWQPGGDLTTAYNNLMAKIAASPLPVPGTTRTVGPGEAFAGVAVNLYDEASWPDLASALEQAQHGNGTLLLQASDRYTERQPDGNYGNELEASNAVTCVDQPWPKSVATLQQDAVKAKAKAPEFGVSDLYGGIPCALWPYPPTSHPMAINAPGSPTILVVGSTGDPATPYADSQALAKQLQHGELLTRVGDGHTGYPFSACIRNYVDDYLSSLTSPPPGTLCPTP